MLGFIINLFVLYILQELDSSHTEAITSITDCIDTMSATLIYHVGVGIIYSTLIHMQLHAFSYGYRLRCVPLIHHQCHYYCCLILLVVYHT